MLTPIVFDDVELWASGYLRAALADYGYPGTFVSNRRESQATAVQVRRDGGPAQIVTEDARLGVNVFAPTEKAATDLANTVAALMRAAVGEGPVKWVRQTSGPSPIVDAASPRRYMTFELTLIGSELSPV